MKNIVVDAINRLFKNNSVTRSTSADKVNTYQSIVSMLRRKVQLKNEQIKEIESMISNDEYDNHLEKLQLLEQCVDLQLNIIDIEVEIEAKNYYNTVHSNMARYFEENQKKIAVEADKNLPKAVSDISEYCMKEGLSKERVAQIHGYLHRFYNGFKSINEKNSLYLEIMDFLQKNKKCRIKYKEGGSRHQ